MEASTQRAAAPALLFLGDSRARFTIAHLAPHVCSEQLSCHHPAICLDGSSRRVLERAAGTVQCDAGAALSRIGYALHYGVAPSGPYHKAPGHYTESEAKRGSLAMVRATLRKFLRASRAMGAPTVVAFSSLVWDLGRRLLLRDTSDAAWISEYEANFSVAVEEMQKMLDAEKKARLLLIADYGCEHGDGSGGFCARWGGGEASARAAAAAVARVGKRWRVSVVDLESPFRDRLRTLLMPQTDGGRNATSTTYLHPDRSGSCVQWGAMRATEPSLPPARSCAQWCRRLASADARAVRRACVAGAGELESKT